MSGAGPAGLRSVVAFRNRQRAGSSGMALFRRRRRYDRSRLLEDAAKARKRGRRRKAIELYRVVLAKEPTDVRALSKIAPILAETKQREEAWKTYQRAVAQLRRQGFVEQAIGLLGEAARHLADEPELWHALADLEVERDRRPDAANALLQGARNFRSRRTRKTALELLIAARRIDPEGFHTNMALGRMLVRVGSRTRGKQLLERLAGRTRGKQRRAVRALLFRISPTPAAALRWLRA